MRFGISSTFVAAICLLLISPAAAQQTSKDKAPSTSASSVGDPEAGTGASGEPTKRDPLVTEFKISSEVHSFDNLDFRQLDEISDQAVIDSDDRGTFAYSSLSAKIGYYVNKETTVGVAVGHNGLWSEDQLGQEANATGVFYFSEAVIHYTGLNEKVLKLKASVGRQKFAIGGVPRDYVLDDTVDALVLTAEVPKWARLRVMAFDLYSQNDVPDQASFVDYMGGREPTLGMRGDTFTVRTGGVVETAFEDNPMLKGLEAKAYYFFADIGGGPIAESGSDVAYGGTLGNFSDNDWAAVAGARVSYTLDLGQAKVGAFGEGGQSFGIDRKELVARDVTNEGMMFGGGATAGFELKGMFEGNITASFYHFDGGTYSSDGLQQSHGFVGFNGKRVGGVALSQYAGWRPSAYLSSGGVRDNPNDVNRGAGTDVAGAEISVKGFEIVGLKVGWWQVNDTSESFINNFNDVDLIDPPFGYSRDEYLAEERFGESLGQELDVQLSLTPNKELEFFGAYSMFTPGAFYELEIEKVAGSALGSPDPQQFWAATGGARVTF